MSHVEINASEGRVGIMTNDPVIAEALRSSDSHRHYYHSTFVGVCQSLTLEKAKAGFQTKMALRSPDDLFSFPEFEELDEDGEDLPETVEFCFETIHLNLGALLNLGNLVNLVTLSIR